MAWFANRRGNDDPVQQLEGDLTEKRAQREKLVARLTPVEPLILQKRAAVEALALNGATDAELDRAEAEVRAAEDRGQTLRGALDQLDQAIVITEGELASAIEHRDREDVAEAVEEMAAGIANALPKYLESAQVLSDAISKSPVSSFETQKFVEYLVFSREDVAAACQLIHAELVSKARGVRLGVIGYGKRTASAELALSETVSAGDITEPVTSNA